MNYNTLGGNCVKASDGTTAPTTAEGMTTNSATTAATCQTACNSATNCRAYQFVTSTSACTLFTPTTSFADQYVVGDGTAGTTCYARGKSY